MPVTAPTGPLATEHLAPTTLEELNTAAGLLTRVDRKYLVGATTAQDVIDVLAERARVLDIDGRRSFSYASTYFDTPALDSYHRAARKRRRRFKIRTRSYLDSELTFLEVKTRGARGATVKQRLPYRAVDAGRVTASGLEFIVECLASSSGSAEEAHRIARALMPTMSTTYRRTTLHLPTDEARATIDTDLTWTALAPGPGAPGDAGSAGRRARPGAIRYGLSQSAGPLAVIETKNPATPSPTDRHLWSNGHRPSQISKYATGMAALHPELPANKWHRLLTHELAGTTRITRGAGALPTTTTAPNSAPSGRRPDTTRRATDTRRNAC